MAATVKHQFRVCGHVFSLSKEDIERKLAKTKPEEVRKLYVWVNHRKFPVKQALKVVQPELLRSACTSAQAMHVFEKCGFTVGEQD